MGTLKPALRVVSAIVPIVYCGYLFHYFYNVAGSMEEAQKDGLGPTLFGLAFVGLLFLIPLFFAILRLFVAPRPRPSGSGGRRGPDGPSDDGGFDADAAVARYMARKAKEEGATSPAGPPATEGGSPAKRTSFGRKSK